MKAFEQRFPKPTIPPGPFGENYALWEWEECREGWKAALEFVKSQTVANSFITESMPDTRVIDMKIIEKELTDD